MKNTKNEAIKEYKDAAGHTLYMFNIRLGGKPTKRRGFKSYRAANAEYTHLKNDDFNGEFDEVEVAPFVEDFYSTWYDKVYSSSVKESTAEKTDTILHNHILPAVGKKRLDEVTSSDAQKIVDKAAMVYAKYKTVYNYARRFFRYAVIDNKIETNPFDHVLVPQHSQATHRDSDDNFWSTEEMKLFLRYLEAAVDDTAGIPKYSYAKYAFFRLMATTGLRKGEELALTVSDLDFDENTVDVNKTLVALKGSRKKLNPPKWNSYRTVTFDKKTAAVLQQYVSALPSDDPKQLVFPNEKNTYFGVEKPNPWLDAIIRDGEAEFTSIYRLTGSKDYKHFVHRITPHGLRHTHTTWLFENNPTLTIKSVQERLGHKTQDVTMQIYNHVTAEQQKSVKDTINDHVDF